jgi:hypothetical protein
VLLVSVLDQMKPLYVHPVMLYFKTVLDVRPVLPFPNGALLFMSSEQNPIFISDPPPPSPVWPTRLVLFDLTVFYPLI